MLATNGTNDLHILDISDPSRTTEVGRWGLNKENKTLHDVIVQDGYAYLSYWGRRGSWYWMWGLARMEAHTPLRPL